MNEFVLCSVSLSNFFLNYIYFFWVELNGKIGFFFYKETFFSIFLILSLPIKFESLGWEKEETAVCLPFGMLDFWPAVNASAILILEYFQPTISFVFMSHSTHVQYPTPTHLLPDTFNLSLKSLHKSPPNLFLFHANGLYGIRFP